MWGFCSIKKCFSRRRFALFAYQSYAPMKNVVHTDHWARLLILFPSCLKSQNISCNSFKKMPKNLLYIFFKENKVENFVSSRNCRQESNRSHIKENVRNGGEQAKAYPMGMIHWDGGAYATALRCFKTSPRTMQRTNETLKMLSNGNVNPTNVEAPIFNPAMSEKVSPTYLNNF